ncbi:MAG: hypothetical protein ACXVFM_16090 [Solirubrobacteraceae bacterium]
MAQECTVARGQQGGDEVAILGEQFGRHGRVDTAVDEMQPANAQGAIDRRAVDLSGQQLSPADNAVLRTSDDPNRPEFSSVSEGNSGRLAHAAMVGASAVPAQHPVCINSAQEPPRLSAHQHDAPGSMVIRRR